MNILRASAVAALSVALTVPLLGSASAADSPTIGSLSVTAHSVPSLNFDAVIDWSASGGAETIEVDLYNEASGETWPVSWSTQSQASGSYELPRTWPVDGVYYALSARVLAANQTTGYELHSDAPLLDDVWFALEATEPAAPSAPRITENTMGGPLAGEIAVVCSRSVGNGLPILTYSLTATPVAGGDPVTVTHNGQSRCSEVIGGLVPGASYDLTAVARTGAGESVVSNTLRRSAGSAPPTAPDSLQAIPGDGSADLAWAPSNGYGLPITAYAVEVRSPDGVDEYGSFGAGADAPPSLQVNGLVNETEYDFRVAANTSLGWGEWSDWSDPFTPSAPAVLLPPSFTANWADQPTIVVEWDEVTVPVDDPASTYEVELSGVGESMTSGEVDCCSWTSDVLPDVTETYTIRMRARNSAGWSEWSTGYEVFPVPPPSAVQDLSVIGLYGRAKLNWVEPLTGVPSGGYAYSVVEAGASEAEVVAAATGRSSAGVTGLVPGEDYVASVYAIGTLGREGPVSEVNLTGTQTWVRAATSITPRTISEVRGRSISPSDAVGIGGVTVTLQRRAVGGAKFRSTDVTAVTRPLGRFTLSFVPRRGVDYRVALVGQVGLGGSASAGL
ncbi:MAG: fibronectin type III domain-containing protein [Actinomycetes bacterium]